MSIDGMGLTNIDKETGIRFGVISQNECVQAWADSAESDYGPPCCPKCGNEADDINADGVPDLDSEADGWNLDGSDYACLSCQYTFDSDEAYGDEALAWNLDDGEYKATQSGGDGDIFILKSPYYTLCSFCSPCAPGAGYLTSEGNVKAYCFGHDWFYDHPEHPNVAPYTVYRVSDDSVVEPE